MNIDLYVLLYLVFYLFFAFGWPSYRTWKQTGLNPVVFGTSDSAHDYIGKMMKIVVLLLIASSLSYTFGFSEWFSPFLYLDLEILGISGLFLIHFSLLWIAIAQHQMGKNWRIGIDQKHKTDLETGGLFQFSRNPIFLGMILSVTGLFFIQPNAVTFFVWLTSIILIQIQIRLEEEYLTGIHGNTYLAYKARVRRFL